MQRWEGLSEAQLAEPRRSAQATQMSPSIDGGFAPLARPSVPEDGCWAYTNDRLGL